MMKKMMTLLLACMLTAVMLLPAATALADFTRAPKDNAIAYITTTYKCGCVRTGHRNDASGPKTSGDPPRLIPEELMTT